ncbi:MAG: hypothetical protein P4N41_07305 [Negativicutes bacterium]|nr:hypothetical protein [Negativicutes bacterium]
MSETFDTAPGIGSTSVEPVFSASDAAGVVHLSDIRDQIPSEYFAAIEAFFSRK